MDSVSWLHWFESTYRARGVLDAGHRFTDADFALVVSVLEGRAPDSVLVLGTRWLRDRALEMPDAHQLLGEIQGGSIARWQLEDYTTWDVLLPRLAAISRGAFPLDELRATHLAEDDGEFLRLECVVAGTPHHARFRVEKYGRVDELLDELNRWIASSGRRFVRMGESFACVRQA